MTRNKKAPATDQAVEQQCDHKAVAGDQRIGFATMLKEVLQNDARDVLLNEHVLAAAKCAGWTVEYVSGAFVELTKIHNADNKDTIWVPRSLSAPRTLGHALRTLAAEQRMSLYQYCALLGAIAQQTERPAPIEPEPAAAA